MSCVLGGLCAASALPTLSVGSCIGATRGPVAWGEPASDGVALDVAGLLGTTAAGASACGDEAGAEAVAVGVVVGVIGAVVGVAGVAAGVEVFGADWTGGV